MIESKGRRADEASPERICDPAPESRTCTAGQPSQRMVDRSSSKGCPATSHALDTAECESGCAAMYRTIQSALGFDSYWPVECALLGYDEEICSRACTQI